MLSDEKRKFLKEGFHRLACSPLGFGPEFGNKEGLFIRLPPPEMGSEDCLCKDLVLKLNGEVV